MTAVSVSQPPEASAGRRSLDTVGGANEDGECLLSQKGFSNVERVSKQNKD